MIRLDCLVVMITSPPSRTGAQLVFDIFNHNYYQFHVDYIDGVFGDESLWPSQPNYKALSRIFITDFGDKVSNRLSHCGGV
jgi:hypothetical protein